MPVVAVLGASEDPSRASNLACRFLAQSGYKVYAVSLHGSDIQGATGRKTLADINEPIDTVSLYLNPNRQLMLIDQIIDAQPRRVIFNPGTESEATETRLREANIKTLDACTLVLLKTGRFDI